MLYNPAVKPGRTHKLHCPWEKEPYVVLEKVSDVDYKIKKQNAKSKIVHFNRLKKFVASEPESEVRIEANKFRRNTRFKPKNKQPVLEKGHNPDREQQFAAPGKSRRENTGTDDIGSEDEEQNSVHELSIADDDDSVDERVDSDSENINSEVEEDDDGEVHVRPQRERRSPAYLQDFETDM
ncbi:unnamed protein product [Mytilus edulis]|uniref:Integrase p58-like C-terminal domain-containing protein n=1 Tax=Mytilus edulis TaxID=6550 RepID=A0A8S3VQC3_MYTED|nr:unnamed protein product [Mytilus edulis]